MRVLVTGGAGFIGSHTVDRLIGDGFKVRVIDSLEKPVHMAGKPDYLNKKAEYIFDSFLKRNILKQALRSVDYVIHLAAYQDYLTNFSKYFQVNSVGTALIYELVVQHRLPVKKIVVASSQAVMGEGKYCCKSDGAFVPDMRNDEALKDQQWNILCPRCGKSGDYQISDENITNPQNQYAMSKYSQEMIAVHLGKRYGIPSVALRYSIVQGARQSLYNAYSGACRIFSLCAYLGKEMIIYEDGKSIRDFVNIHDVVDANMIALLRPETDYQVYNVGGAKGYTVNKFAQIVAEIFGRQHSPVLRGEFRYGDTRHIFSDVTKMRKLGWKPKRDVRNSIKEYKEYLSTQRNIDNVAEESYQKMKKLKIVRKAE